MNVGCNVTIWIDIVFEHGENFQPVGIWLSDGQRLRLTLRPQFQLAGKIGAASGLGQWWRRTMLGEKQVAVEGLVYERREAWFRATTTVEGTTEQVAQQIAIASIALVKFLRARLDAAGFDLGGTA